MMLPDAPFVAAVGVENADQYAEVCDATTEIVGDSRDGYTALGILMGEKTGLLGVPNRHGPVYPLFKEVEEICDEARRTVFAGAEPQLIIHYNTDNPFELAGQLTRAIAPLQAIDLIQINNLDWFHLPALREVTKALRDRKIGIVLQAHPGLIRDLTPTEFAKAISKFAYAVDYLWIDASGGLGEPLYIDRAIEYLDAIYGSKSDLCVGVAGGLTPDNVQEMMAPIVQRFPDVSWDAQTGVQTVTDAGEKHFDVDKAVRFLVASIELRRQ